MAQQLESLKAHLAVVKNSPADKIEEDFYQFMIKAKDTLGETSYLMAQFYYQYGHFILQKLQANLDLFNEAAVPKNVHEEQEEEFENIPEDFEQDSSEQIENQSPSIPQLQLPQDKVQLRDDQPQIIEDGEDGEEKEKVEEAGEPEGAQNEDDKDISAINLQMAVTLYQQEHQKIKNGNSSTSIDEVLDGLRKARTRLGDLYMNDENYAKSIEYYQKVIELQSEREGFECNRIVSGIYYVIGNLYLYENKPGCEIKALSEYIKATNILLNHLNLTLKYDISGFDIPTSQKTKVDRFPYLSAVGDSPDVIQIKEIICCLLDKIEDAESQIAERESYEKEKKKIQEEKNLSQFKPVEDKTKVINLGTFGNRNRKKMPEDQSKPATPFKLNGEINQSAETQAKKLGQTEKKPPV